MKKRLLASLLAVVMVFASLLTPMGSDISVLAAETALVTSGTCGENSTWFFDSETGVLYLEGSGSVEQGNWYNYEDKIQMIVIGEDISEIDNESIERKSSGNYSNFMNIEVDSNNPYFSTIDGVLFNKSGSVLIWYPKNRSGSYNIPEGVMRIEEYAFYNCREITTVTIPSSVSTIASDAFYSCVELSQVNFTEGLEVIENRAFQGCVRLKEIIIPSTVTNIGERAFAKCAASKYGVVGLEKVQILGTNTTLEGSVFFECTGLKYVETSSDVGPSAFVDCVSLEEVVLHEGVEKIGENAFARCTSLTMIDISKSVTEISGSAFWGCNQLKGFTVDSENTSFSVEDGVLFNKDKTKIIRYPNGKSELEYEVPKTVVNLDKYAFASCRLQEINLHSNLKDIGHFSSCESLKSFVIPDGVTDASEMLEYCSALEYIVVPRSVKEIGSYKANDFMLAGCSDALVIYGYSNTVVSNFNTFICLDDGISVKLDTNGGSNSSVSQITVYPAYTYGNMPIPTRKGYIFKGWYTKQEGGKEVESDTLVETVQEHTLYAQWEKEISPIEQATVILSVSNFIHDGTEKKPNITVKYGNKILTEGIDYTVSYTNNIVVGTATVTIIGTGSYTGTQSKTYTISTASINDATVALETTSYTYDGKAKTPSVTVKVGNRTLTAGTDYTVTYKNNKNIGEATITITGKGNYTGTITKTFAIEAKKDATFTSGKYKYKVTDSSTVAFAGIKSTKTTKVNIPETVEYGGVTFKVTSIVDNALKGKTKVTSVTIPSTVTKIGKKAFYGCKNLKTITINSEKLTKIGSNALKGINSKATINVPTNKYSSYKKLLKGKGQGSKVSIVIHAKKGDTFTSENNKYKVTGSSTVEFTGLKSTKKTEVSIPKTVKYGEKTFKVTAIAEKALKGNTKVKKVTVGESVKEIGASAFYGCKNLKTITIKSTKLETVGKNAFKKINSKATIKVPKSKLTRYEKLLKGKGQGSKVKIVKYK